jgi:ribosome-binding factor A
MFIPQHGPAKGNSASLTLDGRISMNRRTQRIGELLRKELSWLLAKEMNDPRLPTLVSITLVEVSGDLRRAKVFVSVMGDSQEKRSTLEMLNSAARFLQRELKPLLDLRVVPHLTFRQDNSIEQGIIMLQKLDGLDNPIIPSP